MFEAITSAQFTGCERLILRALTEAFPEPVKRIDLVEYIYGFERGPQGPENVVKQIACRLRHKLPKLGWTITKDTRSSRGYQLTKIGGDHD